MASKTDTVKKTAKAKKVNASSKQREVHTVNTAMPKVLEGYSSYHAWLSSLEQYKEQIQYQGFYAGRDKADYGIVQGDFATYLEKLNLHPYKHQAEALNLLNDGHNIVIATPTASGKSLSYQTATLKALDDGETAIYLFPTKALAHDQLSKLKEQAKTFGLEKLVSTYDGDTPATKRPALREKAGCILTNPDMLHYGILPHHKQWAKYLGRLRYVVIDELHSYRGVMGTHVANILKRLLRLAEHYGAKPQIIAASATIANPAEHAKNLTSYDFVSITQDFGIKSERELLFWQPPNLAKEGEEPYRRSVNTEAADLAVLFCRLGLKSIFFTNSRKSAELLKRYANMNMRDNEVDLIQSYRAGYTAKDRRQLEEAFKAGDIRILAATSALELGVDVGGVDAVVMLGYPGSMTSFWQRAGRAGRSGMRALTLMIPSSDPLDEYYLHHPDLIADGRAEKAVADGFNSEIHPLHLHCAARELPVTESEAIVGDYNLDQDPKLYKRTGSKQSSRWGYQGGYPHRRVSVRGLGGKKIILRDSSGKRLGESDFSAAIRELHPGAVYLQKGENYLVRNLDLEKGEAILLPHIADYYTQARREIDVDILEHLTNIAGINIGRVRVSVDIHSYVKKKYFSEAVLEERVLDLPQVAYNTQALWFDITPFADSVAPPDLPSAMHALEHTLIGLLPVFVMCERADVGGLSHTLHPSSDSPIIFIYDGYPGGVGYSYAGATLFYDWLSAAVSLLQDCPCTTGCPRCVLSPKCGNGNMYLDKTAALALGRAILEKQPSRVMN